MITPRASLLCKATANTSATIESFWNYYMKALRPMSESP